MGFWFAYMGIEGGGGVAGVTPTIPGLEYDIGIGPMHYDLSGFGPMHYSTEDE